MVSQKTIEFIDFLKSDNSQIHKAIIFENPGKIDLNITQIIILYQQQSVFIILKTIKNRFAFFFVPDKNKFWHYFQCKDGFVSEINDLKNFVKYCQESPILRPEIFIEINCTKKKIRKIGEFKWFEEILNFEKNGLQTTKFSFNKEKNIFYN